MSQILIDYYKAIEESSARMLEAARTADWDSVVRYEAACAVLIEQLRYRAQSESLDAAAKAEKSLIMRRILQNDAQIRDMSEPWLSELDDQARGKSALLH